MDESGWLALSLAEVEVHLQRGPGSVCVRGGRSKFCGCEHLEHAHMLARARKGGWSRVLVGTEVTVLCEPAAVHMVGLEW